MKSTILLNSNENLKQVEEEEKARFVKNILEVMGVPIGDFWQEIELSVEDKIRLRGVLSAYSIKIIDESDGHLQFYVEDQLVGEWNKPLYKWKRDLSEIDPNKKLYLEMYVDCWSIFDEEN